MDEKQETNLCSILSHLELEHDHLFISLRSSVIIKIGHLGIGVVLDQIFLPINFIQNSILILLLKFS